jgi:hypothetical protein
MGECALAPAYRRTRPTDYERVPPRCPHQQPSTANDRHQQQFANMKLAQALNPRATHESPLVMRNSAAPLAVLKPEGSPVAPEVGGPSVVTAAPEIVRALRRVLPNEPQDGPPPQRRAGRTRMLAGIYPSGVSWICSSVVPKKPLALVCPTAVHGPVRGPEDLSYSLLTGIVTRVHNESPCWCGRWPVLAGKEAGRHETHRACRWVQLLRGLQGLARTLVGALHILRRGRRCNRI